MLTRLCIQDVVLIEKLALDLGAGLNVFTGETGAGKSIVLDSLALALGARSDAALLRTGSSQASVTAEFSTPLPPALQSLLADQGLEDSGDTLILRRTLSKEGKSRAFVNDAPVSIGLLKQIGALLLEIHGQFDTHGLLNPATHRDVLDSFAGRLPLAATTRQAFDSFKEAENACAGLLAETEKAANEEAFLRAALSELDDLAPQTGELDKLAAHRTELQNAGKIIEALQTADTSLTSESGATARLTQAGKALARIESKTQSVGPLLALIDRLAEEASEASRQITSLLYAIDGDPHSLDKIEERLFALRALARKHNILPDELPSLHEKLAARLALLTNQDAALTTARKQVEITWAAFLKNAKKLSTERKAAAERLATAVTAELKPLKFETARFFVAVEPQDESAATAHGLDKITFLATTNAGQSAGPIAKIASGGELARFMLALKVVLAASDPVPVLVFDEVDAGVGGATASSVGERLAILGRDVQILVVTHSPQVAARGTHHYRVHKATKGGTTQTDVQPLTPDDRIEEIARMLAGTKVTDAARQAARDLIITDHPPTKSKAPKKAPKA